MQQIIGNTRESNKGKNYIELKENWTQEKYLSLLEDKKAITLFKYRTSNHRLPVETGRFYNIDYKNRKCLECSRDIGDEFHYLLKCPVFDSDRKKYLSKKHIKHPNMMTYKEIVMSTDETMLSNVCVFIRHIIERIRT